MCVPNYYDANYRLLKMYVYALGLFLDNFSGFKAIETAVLLIQGRFMHASAPPTLMISTAVCILWIKQAINYKSMHLLLSSSYGIFYTKNTPSM